MIRRAPQFAEAYNNLGLLWLQTGKLSEAESVFREAIQRKPDYAAAHYNLGLTLLKSGHSMAAQTQFETAHRLDPQISQ